MIKAVIFDLDGTMLDRDSSLISFLKGQYRRLNGCFSHITEEEFIHKFIEYDKNGYVWKDIVYQKLVSQYKMDASWEELLDDYLTYFKYHCLGYKNLHTTLEFLKNQSSIKLGIISNGRGQFQMDNIEALNIRYYFDVILISEWEGLKKPHPEIFYRATEKLNLHNDECIFVGDHPLNDIDAARKIGMKTIWKQNSATSEKNGDYQIKDLAEIIDIILYLNKQRS